MATEPGPVLYDVSTLGETLLRIGVAPGVRLETASAAALHAAGSESNVACALATLDRCVAWASRLPDNPPGRLVANALRQSGVRLDHLTWCDDGRVGTFYVELAPPPVPVRVTYDRAGSCASGLVPDAIDWHRLLRTRLLHLTGITPALSEGCLATTREAVRRARQSKVPISFDVNYRRKLWSPAQARTTLLPLLSEVDLLFVAESDAKDVFGLAGLPETCVTAVRKMTGARLVVMTVGDEGVIAFDGVRFIHEPARPTFVIDRLGAGDALAAGVIHGWLDHDIDAGVRAGVELAALCLRGHGDIVHCTPAELAALMSATGDRPQR